MEGLATGRSFGFRVAVGLAKAGLRVKAQGLETGAKPVKHPPDARGMSQCIRADSKGGCGGTKRAKWRARAGIARQRQRPAKPQTRSCADLPYVAVAGSPAQLQALSLKSQIHP